jgi:hypothetical protein
MFGMLAFLAFGLAIGIANCFPNIVIKVAHLQPNNPSIMHEPQVLEM